MQAKKIAYIALAGIFAFIIALVSLGPNRYASKVAALISSEASKNQMMISFDKPTLSLLSFGAGTTNLFYPKAFLPLIVHDLKLSIQPLSLLALNLIASASGKAYQGEFTAIGSDLTSPLPMLESLHISSAQIGEHPWVSTLGMSAKLSLSASKLRFTPSGIPSSGVAKIEIREFQKPKVTSFVIPTLGLPINLPIITQASLDLSCDFSEDQINCPLLDLKSSLGNLSGQGNFKLITHRISTLNFSMSINLSDEGIKFLGDYLPFISPKLNSKPNNFALTLSGDIRRPAISIEG